MMGLARNKYEHPAQNDGRERVHEGEGDCHEDDGRYWRCPAMVHDFLDAVRVSGWHEEGYYARLT